LHQMGQSGGHLLVHLALHPEQNGRVPVAVPQRQRGGMHQGQSLWLLLVMLLLLLLLLLLV